MNWNEKKIEILKENWGKLTASAIAEKIGDISRNAVIGKAYRLNLSSKIKVRNVSNSSDVKKTNNEFQYPRKRGRKSRFKSLLLDKKLQLEPARLLTLEELSETTCKYMIHEDQNKEGHPDVPGSFFCGRKTIEKYSYCIYHMALVWQPKGKKEDDLDRNNEISQYQYIEKKDKLA